MNTISELCEAFTAFLSEKNLELKTIYNYHTNLKRFFFFLRDNFGWSANEQIQPHHLRGYYLALFLAGTDKLGTAEKKLCILRSWAESCKFKLPSVREFKGPLPSLEELGMLFALTLENLPGGSRDKLLLSLLLCYGLTSSELVRLKVQSVDLEKQLLALNLNNNLYPRALPLIPIVSHQLVRYIAQMKPRVNLLVNVNSQPLTEAGLRYILKLLLAKAGLPNYTYQDIRRGWLKHLATREPIAVVLSLSGLGPLLPNVNYQLVLEEWHELLTNSGPLFKEINSRSVVAASSQCSDQKKA